MCGKLKYLVKNYVRIIISPFDVPVDYDSNYALAKALENQIA